jgi:hypothetical protein
MDATEELFSILDDCTNWNDESNTPVSHDSKIEKIQSCIDNGADLLHVYPDYRFTPLLYGLFLKLHPDIIRALASKGYDLDLKLKFAEYVYDDYDEVDYYLNQIASIKNFILEAYYISIGEHIELYLLELFTERHYIKKKYEISEYDIYLSWCIKEYCKIFNLDYNTISEWKIEVPDDFKTSAQ